MEIYRISCATWETQLNVNHLLYFQMSNNERATTSYDHCEGANGRQGREAVALTLVATAITATLEAGLDGRVRILAEAAGGISAARRAT